MSAPRFSLAAPPSSGKISRKEKVSRSGRSTSFDTDELQIAAQQAAQASAAPSFPTIVESNPFASFNSTQPKAAPAPAAAAKSNSASMDFFGSSAAPSSNTGSVDNMFDFLLESKPAPKPQPQQQQPAARAAVPSQPQQQASSFDDPFSQAFSSKVTFSDPFDPFGSSGAAAAPAAQQQKPAPSPKKAAAKKGESSSDESSDSSSSESSSDSSSDDSSDSSDSEDERVGKKKKAKKQGVKGKASLPSASASNAASTSNKSIAAGGGAVGSGGAAGAPPTLKVDVLAYMKKGTPFLKYGKSGYPHFRQFQLSEDNSRIVWFSQNKKTKDTQVDLYTVDELRYGQGTANFARHPAPDLDKSSFSLIYDHGRATLDLIAKDPNEYKIWTKGLDALLKICNGGANGSLESLKTLPVDMGIQSGRRSSVDIVDMRTGQNASQLSQEDEEAQSHRPRALSTGNKQMYKEVAKNFQTLKHKLNKRQMELREPVYYNSPQFDSMQQIVKRVQESVQKVQELFQDGEYGACDDEIWRGGVDLESLKNIMRAVAKP